jgi:hypothetical protein
VTRQDAWQILKRNASMRISSHVALVFFLALQYVSYQSFASELTLAGDGRTPVPMHDRCVAHALVALLQVVVCMGLSGQDWGELFCPSPMRASSGALQTIYGVLTVTNNLRNREGLTYVVCVRVCRAIVIICLVDGSIHAFEAESGQLRWSISSGSSVLQAHMFSENGKKNVLEDEGNAMQAGDGRLPAAISRSANSVDTRAQNGDQGQLIGEEMGSQDVVGDAKNQEETGSHSSIAKRVGAAPAQAIAEIPSGDDSLLENNEPPAVIIPSYERGGGLWVFKNGGFEKLPISAR